VKLVRLRLEAELEFFEATLWYETEREGLGFEFDSEVNATLDRVAHSPKHFPVVGRDIRRAIVDRFPYGISSSNSKMRSR
jgi:toxin ParE1/3/4